MSLCNICCDTYLFKAVTECGHETCAKCMLTEKYLCGRDKCLFCSKEKVQTLILPATFPQDTFRQLKAKNQLKFNSKYKVFVHSSAEVYIAHLDNPPCPNCNQQFISPQEMQIHLQQKHKAQYCKICTKSKPVFKIDQKLYQFSEIQHHLESHPACSLCTFRQYDKSYLLDHYKVQHVRCEICRTFGVSDSFWDTQKALQEHIKEAHFACNFSQCNNDGFGFANEEEQVEHLIEVHAAQLTKGQISEFKNKLSILKRSKKFFDVNQYVQFSIEKRGVQRGQKVVRTTEYQQETENMYLQDYLASVSMSGKKGKVNAPQQHTLQYVEYVEPEMVENEYKGITKQSVNIDINMGIESQYGQYQAGHREVAKVDSNPFADGFGFKIKKAKSKQSKINQQEKQAESMSNIKKNQNILDDDLYNEFAAPQVDDEPQKTSKKGGEHQMQQLFEISKTDQKPKTNQPKQQEQVKFDIFGVPIKVVKSKKQQKHSNVIDDDQQETKLLFDPIIEKPHQKLFETTKQQPITQNIDDKYQSNDHVSNNFTMNVKVVKQKAKKQKQATIPEIEKETVQLFEIQQPEIIKQKQDQLQKQSEIDIIIEKQVQKQQTNFAVQVKKTKQNKKQQNYETNSVPCADLTLTAEELENIKNPSKQAFIMPESTKKQVQLYKNEIYIKINSVFPLIPSEIAISRFIENKLVATFCLPFGYDRNLIIKVLNQMDFYSEGVRIQIKQRLQEQQETYFNAKYVVSEFDYKIDKIQDFGLIKSLIVDFCTGNSQKVEEIQFINTKVQVQMYDSFNAQKEYDLNVFKLENDLILTKVIGLQQKFKTIELTKNISIQGCKKHHICALDNVKAIQSK